MQQGNRSIRRQKNDAMNSRRPSRSLMLKSTSWVHGECSLRFASRDEGHIDITNRDTVSAIGLSAGPRLPITTTGMKHVCHFRQALALDERRVIFWPEYANQSAESSNGGDVKEVWFVGSHMEMYA